MKLTLPLIAIVLLLASCSTAYKTGQTPDDVYFSPERQRDEYARVEKKQPRYNDERRYDNDEDYREDRYLRMKTSYRRYSTLDDYDCYCYTGSNYNRYYNDYRFNNFGYYNNGWNNTWNYNPSWNYNPYYYNPYYNKPYYSGYVVGNVVQPVYNKPRRGNLSIYNNNNNNTYSESRKGNTRTYTPATNNSENYQNSGTNAGGFLRSTIGGSNSSSTSTPSSSSSNSSSSGRSSSSSSSGSTSAPVRKF